MSLIATILPWGRQQYFDNNGDPLAGGTLRIDLAGTTTLASVYSIANIASGTGSIINPITLNAAGRPTSNGATECSIFGVPGVSYKFTLKDSANVTIWTQDNIMAAPVSAQTVDLTGTAGETLAAGSVVYESDGNGGLTAGNWYLASARNAYSSSGNVTIGMVPNSITSTETGTIRIGGIVTTSGLTIGLAYYVSSTPGAITTSPGANRRLVGQALSTTEFILTGSNPDPSLVDNSTCQGRLTLTSGLPVTTADVTGAATVYFTPYNGNRIALRSVETVTAFWTLMSFSEVSIALGTITSGLPYDVFAYANSGAVALEILAWTNTTTRATALTYESGVLVKSGNNTRRYLGSFFTTSTTQTEDSYAKRLLFNYYNRVSRPMQVLDATNSWQYSTAAFRQMNNSTANQLAIMVGVAEDGIDIDTAVWYSNNSGSYQAGGITAIGEDSASTMISGCLTSQPSELVTANDFSTAVKSNLKKIPAVGYHFYAALEWGSGAGTTTWYGDNNTPTRSQSGINGMWRA